MRFEWTTAARVLPLRAAILRPSIDPAGSLEAARYPQDEDPQTRHLACLEGEVVLGVATLVHAMCPGDPSLKRQLRGMAVRERGRGVGRALLTHLTSQVEGPLWCNARLSARGFYERLGWRAWGEVFEIPTIGPHLWMRSDAGMHLNR